MDLQGKVAVVTGGSKGIGRAVAVSLAEAGANVMINSRHEDELKHAMAEINSKEGGRCAGEPWDIRDFDRVQMLMKRAVQEFGGLDILVNNAGVGYFAHISKLSPQQWVETVETNLTAAYYCVYAALPLIRQRGGGYIFNIASLAAVYPNPGGCAYNASKAGLLAFSECLLRDLRQENIWVSCILPGSVNTYFSGATPEKWERWKLSPKDIAQVILDLLAFDPRALPSRVDIRPSKPPE
jgi:3-oxoacyl-[acyl-carrier protein] reductase